MFPKLQEKLRSDLTAVQRTYRDLLGTFVAFVAAGIFRETEPANTATKQKAETICGVDSGTILESRQPTSLHQLISGLFGHPFAQQDFKLLVVIVDDSED